MTVKKVEGSLFIEILAAFVIVILVLIPLIGGFSTGMKQTQATKSYVSAQAVGTWAVAWAKAQIAAGIPEEGTQDITPMAEQFVKESANQLLELNVRISISKLGSSGRCFSIGVTVSWQDYKINRRRSSHFQSITRSEI